MESERDKSRSLDKCVQDANNNNMTTLCPYCNAVLPALSAPPTSNKLPCPRCGEPVPASRWRVDTAILSAPPPRIEYNGAGKRQTAFIVLGIMVAMAVIGLSYALWTTSLRRSRDPKLLLDPIALRRPLDLQGLGYLPKDSQVIIGLHLAEWLDDKQVGRPLLEEPRPAPLDWVVKQLPRLTGMKLEEIDHVVLAGSFDPPRAVLVLKTRRAYTLEKIVESIRPSQSETHLQHPLYHFSLNPLGNAMLWCVEEKTLICVVPLGEPKLEHLQGLSAEPKKVEEILSAPLLDAMKERLATRQFLWAVGRLGQLGPMKDMAAMMLAGKADLGAIKDLKTFAVGLAPVEGLTLMGHFQVTDAKAAAKFKTRLESVKIEGAKSQKVEISPEVQEPWVTWQVRGDVAAMRQWLNQGKDAKK
jgi:hypothetical protein